MDKAGAFAMIMGYWVAMGWSAAAIVLWAIHSIVRPALMACRVRRRVRRAERSIFTALQTVEAIYRR